MGWEQKIEYEYVDVKFTLPPPVSKQMWDGEKFVAMNLYKIKGWPGMEAENWLLKNFGHAGIYKNGRYWEYSRAGNFTIMDERVYTWYQLKWGNR